MGLVLIVEDTSDNREIYRTILEFAGHSVIQAVNGWEAISAVRSCCPDVILMDVTMPVMDGLEATRRIKSDDGSCDIPILILTANGLPEDQDAALRAGADAYLSKSCTPKDVLLEVERLLQSCGGGTGRHRKA